MTAVWLMSTSSRMNRRKYKVKVARRHLFLVLLQLVLRTYFLKLCKKEIDYLAFYKSCVSFIHFFMKESESYTVRIPPRSNQGKKKRKQERVRR